MTSLITEHVRAFLASRGQELALAAPVAVAACLLLVLLIQEETLRIVAHGRERIQTRALRAVSIPTALIFALALLGHFVRFIR